MDADGVIPMDREDSEDTITAFSSTPMDFPEEVENIDIDVDQDEVEMTEETEIEIIDEQSIEEMYISAYEGIDELIAPV